MSRETFSYTHGDTGSKPANGLDFQQNQRPGAQNFDWFWYNVTDAIAGHASEFTRLDSDDDGVVDAADGASTWSDSGTQKASYPTDVDFTGDLSLTDDGDGTVSISVTTYTDSEAQTAVDGANVSITGDADTVDGEHASAFADSSHNHDSQYVLESGDTMGGDLGLGNNDVTGLRRVDSNDGNHRIAFDANTSRIEVHDQTGALHKLAAADLYVGDGIGWLSNAVNAGGARTAVDGADVSITGDADTVDGEHASAFADAGHNHDSTYITESGDTMSGTLTLSDGNTAASQTWVNNNADVPNADHADAADDATTLDGSGTGAFAKLSDGVEHPVFTSKANVPTSITKGEVVYVDGDGLYVEDGT